jgi:hypothetical protein
MARCAMLLNYGEALDLYGETESALDQLARTLFWLRWWCSTLSDPDPLTSSRARAWCAAIMTNSDDPGPPAVRQAIAEILTTFVTDGHA